MNIFTPPANLSKVNKILLSLLTLLILQSSLLLAQDAPFITVWQTDNEGTSEDNQITIPGTGTDYLIEWEEVDNEAINNGSETGTGTHTVTFPSAGTYRVKISGDFTSIQFNHFINKGDNEKIIDIEQWGDISWSTFYLAFFSCSNLNHSASDAPDLSNVTDMSAMFAGARSFNGDIGSWNVANVITMQGMFNEASSFNEDISSWNVANVITMQNMFKEASSFNGDISSWNVANVSDMSAMFQGARSFSGDISGWNVANVTDMSAMFFGANSFNGAIGNWNVANVTDMGFMFNGAGSFNGDISSWNVANVTDMWSMFSSASSFNGAIGNWDVANVTDMQSMFRDAESFNGDIVNWNVANVTNMQAMFSGARSFSGDISDWNVANVSDMSGMFFGANSFNGAIGNWDVANVTNMQSMFWNAESFIGDIGSWNVANVTNMQAMFSGASSFNGDISDWNVANTTDISGMFYYANSFDQNLGAWNLSSANSLFEFLTNSGLSSANYDLTLEGWVTNGNIPSEIALSAEGLFYCASEEYRQQLIDDYGWNIIGDEACSSILSTKNELTVTHSTYPNPFAEFTTIQFNLPQVQTVNVLVFDAKGKLVRKEQYDHLNSGEQSITFERKDLPAGLYQYQIQSNESSVGGKMLIK